MALDTQKNPSIRKVYNPSEKEHSVLRHVYDRYREMRDKRAEIDKDWDKWEKQWNSFRLPRGKNDWKSNIFVPITASIIEAQLAEIINQELKPWAVARGTEDDPKAMVMNAILEYTWDVAKSDVSLFEMVKDALIFGTGVGMEYYWKQPRTVKDENDKESEILEFDDCYLEPVRLWDFFVDEKARGFSGPFGARDCIRRYVMNYDDFRNFFKGKVWNPLGTAELVRPGGDTNYYEFYKPPEKLDHSREVEVLWYWNKPDDMLAIVANDILVRNSPNPYKHKQLPFVRVTDVKRPYHFYGKGECEILESLQEEVNTLRRMIIDRNHLDIDKPILVSDTLTIDDADVASRPHGIIPVGDVNAAKPLEYSDIPKSVFMSLEMLNDDKVRVTGMDERQQSVSSAGTATEAAILKEATLKRLNLKIWQIKNDTLVDLGRMRVSNILQFYSQPKLEEITGEAMSARAKAGKEVVTLEGKKYIKGYRNVRLKDQAISTVGGMPKSVPQRGYSFFEARPEYFTPTYGSFDIRYKASSSMPISRPLEQQKMDELYDRLIQNPTIDPWKLAEAMLISREKDASEFKMQQPGQPDDKVKVQQMIDLASAENDEMLRGNPIGPTPYASPVHTEIHTTFMQSEEFKKNLSPERTQEVLQLFANHVTGEITAQQLRSGAAPGAGQEAPGTPPGVPSPTGQPPVPGTPMGAVMPDRIQGGGQVPSGMAGANSGVQVGRKV